MTKIIPPQDITIKSIENEFYKEEIKNDETLKSKIIILYTENTFPFDYREKDKIENASTIETINTDFGCNYVFTKTFKKFIGLEKFATVAAKALTNANEYQLNNFKIIVDDAKNLEQIFIGKTNEIWLTFSDPWPKKKHIKRRLTYRSYLALYQKILAKDGLLKIKTDNDAFFAYSIESLKEANWLIIDQSNGFHNHKDYFPEFQTNHEIKWSSLNKNINY